MWAWFVYSTLGEILLLFVILDTLWSIIQLVKAYLTPHFFPNEQQSLITKYGSWAVVTGSTDGIGKAYAFELASRNLNIVLISRSTEKLMKTASEIETLHGVKTKIISADFSDDHEVYKIISNELKDLSIGILVNNVGMNYPYPCYVNEVPIQTLHDIININIKAATIMTRIIIPSMKARKKGAIVNVSSGAELQALPLMAVYAASKAYIKSFTDALRWEFSKHGITVQNLSPMFVKTKMNAFSSQLQKDSLFVPNVQTYARHAVNTLGKVDHTTGYLPHGIQYFFASLAPYKIRTIIGGYINKNFRRDYYQMNKEVKN